MVGANTASHYCAAKAALLGLTKAWAKELAPWNIHVNAVCPGGVITEMPIRVQGWDKIREKEKKVPLGRWAQPEEISYAVAFLASAKPISSPVRRSAPTAARPSSASDSSSERKQPCISACSA